MGSTDHEKIREAFQKENIIQGPASIEGPIQFLPTGDLDPLGMITKNLGGKPVTAWPFNMADEKATFPIPKWNSR